GCSSPAASPSRRRASRDLQGSRLTRHRSKSSLRPTVSMTRRWRSLRRQPACRRKAASRPTAGHPEQSAASSRRSAQSTIRFPHAAAWPSMGRTTACSPDENRPAMLVYDRTAGGFSNDVTEPVQWIFGPKTQLGYIAGVEVDPKRKEFYTVNNDSGDRMVVFSYDDHGNAQPRRTLTLPHQSWDVSLAPTRDEIAITVQQSNAISIF